MSRSVGAWNGSLDSGNRRADAATRSSLVVSEAAPIDLALDWSPSSCPDWPPGHISHVASPTAGCTFLRAIVSVAVELANGSRSADRAACYGPILVGAVDVSGTEFPSRRSWLR
jgi:hypothetical protein